MLQNIFLHLCASSAPAPPFFHLAALMHQVWFGCQPLLAHMWHVLPRPQGGVHQGGQTFETLSAAAACRTEVYVMPNHQLMCIFCTSTSLFPFGGADAPSVVWMPALAGTHVACAATPQPSLKLPILKIPSTYLRHSTLYSQARPSSAIPWEGYHHHRADSVEPHC